jgi:hypothetical protein
MIGFLFNHRSKTLYVVEALSVLGLAAMAWRMAIKECGWFAWLMFAIVVAIYAFIRFCTSVRWYKNAKRYEGIELQFKKAMSPTVYITFIGSLVFQIVPSYIVLIVMTFMLAVVGHVNVILLYLKHRDTQELPINYFSGNKNSNS